VSPSSAELFLALSLKIYILIVSNFPWLSNGFPHPPYFTITKSYGHTDFQPIFAVLQYLAAFEIKLSSKILHYGKFADFSQSF
jgi:hypothetical protein